MEVLKSTNTFQFKKKGLQLLGPCSFTFTNEAGNELMSGTRNKKLFADVSIDLQLSGITVSMKYVNHLMAKDSLEVSTSAEGAIGTIQLASKFNSTYRIIGRSGEDIGSINRKSFLSKDYEVHAINNECVGTIRQVDLLLKPTHYVLSLKNSMLEGEFILLLLGALIFMCEIDQTRMIIL